jgi:hypothetical protein
VTEKINQFYSGLLGSRLTFDHETFSMHSSGAAPYTVMTGILFQWHCTYLNMKVEKAISKTNAYKAFYGKLKKKPPGRHRSRWENNIKMDFKRNGEVGQLVG